MAWVSVHEQVQGRKLKELSKAIGCSQKEALGILVSLWLWGLNNANKDGELIGSNTQDLLEALSGGLSNGLSVDKILSCLIDKGWIDIIGEVYILHDWDTWQEQWYKALDRRAYDANRKRMERKAKKQCPTDNPTDCPPENPVQPSPSPSPSPILLSSIYQEEEDAPVDNSGKVIYGEGGKSYLLINGEMREIE